MITSKQIPQTVDNRKGITLRLQPEVWLELKIMALKEGRTTHKLLMEAVDDLFTKRGKPPIT
jgi:hypothetical protein